MALLQKLKEKLGFGSGSSGRESGETEVTVERESEPAASDGEAAESPSSNDGTAESRAATDEADEPAAAVIDEAEAAASTESLVDEAADEAAEPAEAAGSGDDDVAVDGDDRGPSVEEIKGIGPAYAERLAALDIETVGDLAGADAAAVAEGASVGEKRAATWIDRANEF